jgi:hypothetical protein
MAGDFSRNSLNPPKKYSGVLMQQGRVQVDADWNEQLSLQHYRTYTETCDVIGNCGTPKHGSGFQIKLLPTGGDLRILPGRYYVHGLLCDLDPQKVLISFPAASAGSPPPALTFGLRTGLPQRFRGRFQPLGPVIRPSQWGDAQGQVNVPSRCIDDRELCVGDWVEIFAEGVSTLLTTITAISHKTASTDPNSITPNFYTLTLNNSVSGFQNATTAWLRRVVTFTTQPFLHSQLDASLETSPASSPAQAELQLVDGEYLVALEAWQREVDALEDPHIREVALGGPDTAERLQTTWQVHVVPYPTETSPPTSPLTSPIASPLSSPLDCCSDFPGWDQYKAGVKTAGLMNAQAPPPGNNVPVCQLPPSAGYLGLANQLYRVEIFQSGEYNATATLVWSRDNAMVETDIICIDSEGNVYVSDLGKDDLHSFGQNDWVEIFDRDDELLGNPRFLSYISQPPGTSNPPPCAPNGGQAYSLILSTQPPTWLAGKSNLRLRRWDMPAPTSTTNVVAQDSNGNYVGIPIVPGWIPLENNVQVNFTPGFYATRSYWQIPARTATGDIEWPPYQVPNTNPIPQPPMGVAHYFCRLAILTVRKGKWHTTDCRCTFPELTDICADDICYHGDVYELQANTVQQALDSLGAKLRFHNKMLHGWGVVCGLSVACPGQGMPTSVNVAPGYAIDCDGYDLILDKTTPVDFATILDLSPQQSSIPDGEYELFIERPFDVVRVEESDDEDCCSKSAAGLTAPALKFRAIQCPEPTFGQQIFQGTIWLDFYNKCLKKLVDAFVKEYEESFITSDQQVTRAQALTSSLTNLAVQLLLPEQTHDVYISSDEHVLLAGFYGWLRTQLHDKTFCSLLAGLPEYPAYSVKGVMTTIFGKGFKTRMRVDPKGACAYGVGVDNNIHVYDLRSGQLAAVVELPAPGNATGWIVQDVAFRADGSQLYAIATGINPTTNSADSVLGIGKIVSSPSGITLIWESQYSAGAESWVTLLTLDSVGGSLYAVAQGQGLFVLNTSAAGGVPIPIYKGTAFGHLTAYGQSLFITASSAKAPTGTFDQVLRFTSNPTPQPNPATFSLPAGTTGNSSDDLLAVRSAFSVGIENFEGYLFVTSTSSALPNKQLLAYSASASGQAPQQVDLGENATVRLALNGSSRALMISYEETCHINTVNSTDGKTFTLSPYCPTEVHPTAIAPTAPNQGATVYVLNSTSNTISVISTTMPAFNDLKDLETYRNNAIFAYLQLLAVLLQDVKDCFCDQLQVSCPSCDTSQPGVPLACVSFSNGAVYKVCNFEMRKYVKTFPMVEYWLSLIPVIPLVRYLFERLCCSVLPSAFARAKVPTADNIPSYASYTETIDPTATRNTMLKLQGVTLSKAFMSAINSLTPERMFTLDALMQPVRATPATTGVSFNQISGQSLSAAKQTLATAKINVAAVETYDPSALAKNIADYVSAPSQLPVGSSVTLVTDSKGVVKYYIPTSSAASALQQQVTTLQSQIADLQTKLKTVDDLAAQVKQLESQIPPKSTG